MKENIYSIKDRVDMRYTDIMKGVTDGGMVRSIYQWLSKRPDFKDLDLYKIGEIDTETGLITPMQAPIQVSWESYKFPETKAETKTTEQIAQEAAETK